MNSDGLEKYIFVKYITAVKSDGLGKLCNDYFIGVHIFRMCSLQLCTYQ
jgi:hypothetical protein